MNYGSTTRNNRVGLSKNQQKYTKKHGELLLCHGTHPDNPNFDGGARQRSCHLTDLVRVRPPNKRPVTLCNMLVDSLIPLTGSCVEFKPCRVCFTPSPPTPATSTQ